MIKIDFLEMIDQEFEDFENERSKRKNMKLLIDFDISSISHNGKDMKMVEPKYKKKHVTSVYIKGNKKNNSLF